MESKIPMSTTWVFVGLLAGRGIARTTRGVVGTTRKKALKLAGKDLAYGTVFVRAAFNHAATSGAVRGPDVPWAG